MLQWMTADTEQMKEDGVRFLCRYSDDLGVPYKWSTIMNSLYTAIYDSGFMIALDRHNQVRGVLAYTYGTGEDQQADRTRIEVHLLYIEAGFRTGIKLMDVMDALAEREVELSQPISDVEFYCTPTAAHRRLFGKFATVSNTRMHPCGLLDFYLTTPDRLRQYVAGITSRRMK
jgi:hypothetical protein